MSAGGVCLSWPYGGENVFLCASFNDWVPVEMGKDTKKKITHFTLNLYLPPGTHQYKFKVMDGSGNLEWCYDIMKASVDDGFGGRNNVFTIPYPTQPKPKNLKNQQKDKRFLHVGVNELNPAFDEDKKNVVYKVEENEEDMSRAGKVDADIEQFVDCINAKANYYTTSSCAGRTIVFHKPQDSKYNVDWIFLTHNLTFSSTEIHQKLQNKLKDLDGECWFKMEPPILAIRCRNIQSASRLLNIAKSCGLKNCGIRSIAADGSAMVALVDTHNIQTLIALQGEIVVPLPYLHLLAEQAKHKLSISRQRFDTLKDELNRLL
eukprot:TRINITY_DN2843_c0_g1_i1.p1 TRINITY_DN2843_c0_g1~~TRINITY_DN2843_c0_g1_i1.p1  ORF type:complete len:333 (-),score=93.49 TRINITY_DN2843_c0_g1_i1:89-1045(-)